MSNFLKTSQSFNCQYCTLALELKLIEWKKNERIIKYVNKMFELIHVSGQSSLWVEALQAL